MDGTRDRAGDGRRGEDDIEAGRADCTATVPALDLLALLSLDR